MLLKFAYQDFLELSNHCSRRCDTTLLAKLQGAISKVFEGEPHE